MWDVAGLGNEHIFDILLEYGVDSIWSPVDMPGRSGNILHGLTKRNTHAAAAILLTNAKSSFVSRRDNKGQTPSIIAAGHGHADFVKTWLDHAAHVSLRDAGNQTALTLAKHEGHEDIVKIINEHIIEAMYKLRLAAQKGRKRRHRLRSCL